MKNKISKTLILVIFILTIILSVGCGKKSETNKLSNNEGKLKIVTSFYPMYIFTSNIAKDIENVEVENLTKTTTGCLHDYALTTSDMKTLEDSDIFVINGANMESFMDKVRKQNTDLKVIEASEGIKLIKSEGKENKDGDENPHVWLSITNAIQEVKNISKKLGEVDPKHKEQYDVNAKKYIEQLELEKEKMHDELKDIKYKNIVTFHEAFPYFAEEFGLNIVGVVEREPGSQPSAKELKETIENIKKLNVKAIFVEPQYSPKVAETISKETGIKVYILDPIVTGDMNIDEYTTVMDSNLETLKEALK